MKSRLFKNATSGFSILEALVVIVVTITLAFVLVPALAYQLGWLQPPQRDMDIQLRAVKRPDVLLPPNFRSRDKSDELNEQNEKTDSDFQ
jgi:hypothetical protein